MSFVRSTIIAVFLCAFGTNTYAAGSGVNWLSDPDRAVQQSTASGKPILMQVTASWCGYCHKMFRETYGDQQIVNTVNSNFVCLKLDADKYKKVVQDLSIASLPSTVILTPDLKVINKVQGYRNVSQLSGVLKSAMKTSPAVARRKVETPAPQVTRNNRIPVRTANRTTRSPRIPAPQTRKPQPGPTTNVASVQPVPRSSTTTEINPFAANVKATTPPIRTVSQTANVPDGFKRLCLVTLFDDRRVETGTAEFSTVYRGKAIYFVSELAKARFESNPDRYWPVLDGHCVVSYLDDGSKVTGEPAFGAVFRGRMWFFESPASMKTFIASPQEYLPQSRTPAI